LTPAGGRVYRSGFVPRDLTVPLGRYQPLLVVVLQSVATLPEPQRREYIRNHLLDPIDLETERTIAAALPANSAAAWRHLLACLREWS